MTATDKSSTSPKSSTVTITLTISDVNDNSPNCQPYHILRIPPAPSLLFTYLTIVCIDNDIGVNKDLDFAIQSGNTANDFAINAVNGELQLASAPSVASYTLVINVDDKGVPVLSNIVTVDVIIEQIPIYTNLPAAFPIIEDTATTTTIFTVTSNVITSRARYIITNGNTDNAFAIEESTGVLQLVLNVDREITSYYNLTIKLMDTGTGLNVDSYVEVTINDINDNVPKFDASFYAIQVLETVIATEILKITVTDADDGVNAVVDIAIISGNAGSEFAIDNSGSLQVMGALDYETTSLYELVIEAVDNGIPTTLAASATVLISIQNVNEFQPEFIVTGLSYQTTLFENTSIGAIVYQASAQDLDGTTEFLFKIASGNTNDAFSINSVTAELYLGKPLDRETIDFYNLTLTAETPTGDTATAIIEIQIDDVNDNDPMFSTGVLSLTVNEAASVGFVVTTFVTSDNDINNNALLTLSITSGNADGKFRITGNDLEINGLLDAAAVSQYDLVVTATDQGIPARSSFILVYIFVQASTPSPDFNPNTNSASFLENVPIHYTVYDADATASGSTEGQANRLRYYIVSGNSDALFTIDIITGEITTTGFFDRELTNSYNLDIEARDKDVGTLKDTLSLSITIDDVNDNVAVFSLTFYTGNVDEHSAINDVVITVVATDADIGLNGQVAYAISATPGSADFSVDAISGEVKVASDLDYLTKNSYYLLITAEDNSATPQTSTVGITITINDINDNTPIISLPTYTISVSESASITDTVLLIQASDLDTGVNGDVVYSISTGNVGTAFAVDASGIITVANTLDRTITPTYVLTVIVADQGIPSLSATVTVTVNVLDFNDNTPVLTNLPNTVYIRENDVKGTSVYQIMSSDADSGNNAIVTYYIGSGNPKSLFDVDTASGLVTTLNFLTGEIGSHILTILAKDGGAPRRTATSTLTVNVLTDTAVIPSEFDFTTAENQVANTLVDTVTLDTIVHGAVPNVLFSITEGNINTDFSIGTDGKLFNMQPLDREFISDYYLMVHIEDLNTPPNSHDDRVHVAILDENDNIPIPLNPVLNFPCVENTPALTDLQLVKATDADIGTNADLTFEIPSSEVQAYIHFQIDSNTGMISVKTPPDFETATSFTFDVLIRDNGLPQNTGTVSVVITVIDVTDDTVTNTNLTTGGSVFVSIECSDLAKSGDVVFTLTGDLYGLNPADVTSISYISFNEGSVFRAEAVTGDVILNSVTSLRPHSEYILWVVALITFTSGDTQRTMTVIRIDTFLSEENALLLSHELSEQQLKDLE